MARTLPGDLDRAVRAGALGHGGCAASHAVPVAHPAATARLFVEAAAVNVSV